MSVYSMSNRDVDVPQLELTCTVEVCGRPCRLLPPSSYQLFSTVLDRNCFPPHC